MAKTTYNPPTVDEVASYFDYGFLPPSGTFFSLGKRVYVVKPIAKPDDATVTVNIPVLVRAPSTDAGLQFWESDWTFDPDNAPDDYPDGPPDDGSDPNDDNAGAGIDADDDPTAGGISGRKFHVVTIYNTGDLDIGGDNSKADPSQTLDVERVDSFSRYVLSDDPYAGAGQSWEYEMQLDNVTGEGDQNTPAHFRHKATHVARWYQSDGAGNITDSSIFIDSEYVDALAYQQNDDGNIGALYNQDYDHALQYGWFNAGDGAGGFSTTDNPQPIAMSN